MVYHMRVGLVWALGLFSPLVAQEAALSGFPSGEAAIENLLLSFRADTAPSIYPAYRDILRGLDKRTSVLILVGTEVDRVAAETLIQHILPPSRCTLMVAGDTSVTPWARDRLVALRSGNRWTFISPNSSKVLQDRRGDLLTGPLLTVAFPDAIHTERDIVFEGGDIIYTRGRFLMGKSVLRQDLLEGEVAPENRVRETFGPFMTLGTELGVPHEHLDMYLTVLGRGRVALGDPRLGARLLEALGRGNVLRCLPDFDDWKMDGQHTVAPQYDAIHGQLTDAGFEVVRLPVLHGTGGAMMSWNNALVERRDDASYAFMPSYGVPLFDEEARATFERCGFRVIPVDVRSIASLGGTVRCITNVLTWQEPRPAKRSAGGGQAPAPIDPGEELGPVLPSDPRSDPRRRR